MAEKDMVIETEEKEPVSKNFIEQEIDKDLAEGVYDHVFLCHKCSSVICHHNYLKSYHILRL